MSKYKLIISTHDISIAAAMNAAAAEGFEFVAHLSTTKGQYFGEYWYDRVLMVKND